MNSYTSSLRKKTTRYVVGLFLMLSILIITCLLIRGNSQELWVIKGNLFPEDRENNVHFSVYGEGATLQDAQEEARQGLENFVRDYEVIFKKPVIVAKEEEHATKLEKDQIKVKYSAVHSGAGEMDLDFSWK